MGAPHSLAWLHPTLDRCRELTARRGSAARWTKPADGSEGELITEIDIAIDRLLTEAITERMPDAAILSEESNPDPSALDAATCFVIDPIDGTRELAAGRPGFAISIALLRHGR